MASLPICLRGSYEVVGGLGTSGGEANVVRARCLRPDQFPGTERVIKVYHENIHVDMQALERLQGVNREHVVGLFSFGIDDGRVYEVQEYLADGTLLDLAIREGPLSGARLRSVIKEIATAVHAVHAAGVFHKDIKPANIFVRPADRLDLVLGDFGLSLAADLSKHFVTNSRTPHYAAPEVFLNTFSEKSDWWSVGMVIAELALGSHPLAGLNELAVAQAIHTRAIDVTDIGDARVRSLCQGLLIPDPDRRWGPKEMLAWLHGQDPQVPPWAPAAHPFDGFEFDGQVITEPAQLARALGGAWSDAARLVRGGPNQTGNLRSFLAQSSSHQRIAAVLDDWDIQGVPADVRVARLLVALDPDLPFIPFRDVDVSAQGLRQLAGEILSEGSDSPHAAALSDLQQHHILAIYGGLHSHEALAAIDRRWGQFETQALHALNIANKDAANDEIRLALKARSLACAVDPDTTKALSWRARWIALRFGGRVEWVRPIRRQLGKPGYAMAVVALEDVLRMEPRPRAAVSASDEPAVPSPGWLPPRLQAAVLAALMCLAAVFSSAALVAIGKTGDLHAVGKAVGQQAAQVDAQWLPYLLLAGTIGILLAGFWRYAGYVIGALLGVALLAGGGAFHHVHLPLQQYLVMPHVIAQRMLDIGGATKGGVALASVAAAALAIVLALCAIGILGRAVRPATRAAVERRVSHQQTAVAILAVISLGTLGIHTATAYHRAEAAGGGNGSGLVTPASSVPVNAWVAELASTPVSAGTAQIDSLLE
ncbi:MAG: protein kinase domain-containing protein, partial [Acidimicrobiales bacterium]